MQGHGAKSFGVSYYWVEKEIGLHIDFFFGRKNPWISHFYLAILRYNWFKCVGSQWGRVKKMAVEFGLRLNANGVVPRVFFGYSCIWQRD